MDASFAAREVMAEVDFVVRGEGEQTASPLALALARGEADLSGIDGLVWRRDGQIVTNAPRSPCADLDAHRVGWELADWPLYEHEGGPGRCAVVQYSRGCPHRCTHCGQWRFWRTWRHRDPETMAAQLQLLHDQHGVRAVWFADENWAADPEALHALLEAIADRGLPLTLYGAMCASDVIAEARWLPLYRRAGVHCMMMGIESTDDEVLAHIGKDKPAQVTGRAVELLREHGILSVVNVIWGLGDEGWGEVWRGTLRLRQLGPDFYNALHYTPLPWTPEGRRVEPERVVQTDRRHWDYRQAVLRTRHLSALAMGVAVKLSEVLFYLSTTRLLRLLFSGDPDARATVRSALPRMLVVHLLEWTMLPRVATLSPAWHSLRWRTS